MSQNMELLTTENGAQWTTVSSVTADIQKKEIKPFVILALKELEGIPDDRIASLVNVDKYSAIRAVVRHFTRLKSATKDMWSQEDVRGFLEGIRFTPECISELIALLCSDKLYENVPTHLRVKPGLSSMQWKIDISLSQSNIDANAPSQHSKEVMHRDTFVIIKLILTNGQTKLYKLTVHKFHELRYTVATVLKNMIVLERRKCMRND